MNINKVIAVQTVPFLLSDTSDENIARIAKIFKYIEDDEHLSEREIRLTAYKITSDEMILFVGGGVGNQLDNLTVQLSGEKALDDEIFYQTLQRAKKKARVLSEESAKEWLDKVEEHYQIFEFEWITEIPAF